MNASGNPVRTASAPAIWRDTGDSRKRVVHIMKLSIAAARREAGRIGDSNSKMPGSTFATTTRTCHVGGKLRTIEGSTCHKCYAIRLENYRESARQSWESNYTKATKLIERDPERWAQLVAFQIRAIAAKTGESYHRWFDAGDLDSLAMMEAIVRVVELTNEIRHWLPTREAAIVKAWRTKHGAFPSNLVVRVSATMIGDKPIAGHAHTSTVHRHHETHVGVACEARSRGNQCGPCRACWSNDIANVSYPLH